MEDENKVDEPFRLVGEPSEEEKLKLRKVKAKASLNKWRKEHPEKNLEYVKKWQQTNPEKAKEYQKRWIEKNPVKILESMKKWRDKNPDKIKKYHKKWIEENLEKFNESQKKWRDANPEKFKEGQKKWRDANPEKLKESQKKWMEKNPEKFKAIIFKNMLKQYGITESDFNKIVLNQNGVCSVCGKSPGASKKNQTRLSIDHDHKTGKMRGLLCHKCNVGLGHFNDNPDLLIAALAYLKKWSGI